MPKPSIPITLGGKTRHLRYTFNALCKLEQELGIPMSEIIEMAAGSVSLTKFRAMIWAGLLDEDTNLTVEDVGGWMEESSLDEIAIKFGEAFEMVSPDEENQKNSTSQVKQKKS